MVCSFVVLVMLHIADETSVLDLLIIGCGPAGLFLAAESAKKGLIFGLVGPVLPFTNNYDRRTNSKFSTWRVVSIFQRLLDRKMHSPQHDNRNLFYWFSP